MIFANPKTDIRWLRFRLKFFFDDLKPLEELDRTNLYWK